MNYEHVQDTIMRRKRVAFNCTTATTGGGPKNAALFIERAASDPIFDWSFLISDSASSVLTQRQVPLSDNIYTFPSPARSLSSRTEIRRKLAELNVDLVYTMAGPAYLNIDTYHVMGISNPYLTHAKLSHFFFGRTLSQAVHRIIKAKLQLYYAVRADFFVFQTVQSRDSFCKKTSIPNPKTIVIGNAFEVLNQERVSIGPRDEKIEKLNSEYNGYRLILCPGADYPHKAFTIIPRVAFEIKRLVEKSERKTPIFILTLPFESKQWKSVERDAVQYGVADYVKNFGPYNYKDLGQLMSCADLIFVPSILETFSATYLEAFCFEKPLVVSDVEFSRATCGDAAVYVDPHAPVEAAKSVRELLDSKQTQRLIAQRGKARLAFFLSQQERYSAIVSVLQRLLVSDH